MARQLMPEVVHDQDPVMLPPGATVKEACCRMRERRVGAVLVVDPDRRLLGIFTGRDAVCRMLAEGRDPAAATLAEAMTAHPDTMAPTATAIEALRLMEDGGFRHVPVVAEGKVVGIVSRRDISGLEKARVEDEIATAERMR